MNNFEEELCFAEKVGVFCRAAALFICGVVVGFLISSHYLTKEVQEDYLSQINRMQRMQNTSYEVEK